VPRLREYRFARYAEWVRRSVLADRPTYIAFDTETTGLGFHDQPFCATFTWRGPAGELKSGYVSLEGDDRELGIQVIRDVMDAVPTWVAHNLKFDLQKLELIGALPDDWRGKTFEDTQVVAALLNENDRKALKHLARVHLHEVTDEEAVLKVVRRKLKLKKDDGYHLLPREVLLPYAIKDTEYTARLWELMKPQLPPAVLPAYQREIDVTLVLLDMEANGIKLDMEYLERTTSEYGVRVMEGTDRLAQLTGDPEFNPGSWQQVQAQLARRGIKVDSTAESVLRTLDDDLARAILQYRSDQKMHRTYLRPLLTEQRDGVVNPWFNVVATRTGRMSSSSASQ
jgi:DNA polymerase-1